MRLAALALLLVAACAPPDDLPLQLREAARSDAPFPELEPLDPVLARAKAPGRVTPRTGPRLQAEATVLRDRARAAAVQPAPTRTAAALTAQARDLQARAAALRAQVVDPATPDTPAALDAPGAPDADDAALR